MSACETINIWSLFEEFCYSEVRFYSNSKKYSWCSVTFVPVTQIFDKNSRTNLCNKCFLNEHSFDTCEIA